MCTLFPNARFVASATVNGSLYDRGKYPGLIVGGTESKVIGEIYEIDEETLNRIDEVEAEDAYCRAEVEAATPGGKLFCWVYTGEPGDRPGAPRIPSGDWIVHARDMAKGDD